MANLRRSADVLVQAATQCWTEAGRSYIFTRPNVDHSTHRKCVPLYRIEKLTRRKS